MAQKVGADLWHMDVVCGGDCAWFNDPEYPFGISVSSPTSNFLNVDRLGKRFVNEDKSLSPHGGWRIHDNLMIL
jgi:hypothetical protein